MKVLLVFTMFILAFGCASQKEATRSVQREADIVYGEPDPEFQYKRAILLVNADENLTQEQKSKLTDVIDEYSLKMIQLRIKQSQYRAVLMYEILNTAKGGKNPKVTAAKNELIQINKDGNKDLEKFVKDFEHYAGSKANAQKEAKLRTP